jgi:hypothetical protein
MNRGASSGRVAICLAIFLVAAIPPAYMIYWLLADNSPVSSAEEKNPAPPANPAEDGDPAPVMIPVSPALLASTLEAIWSDSPAEGISFADGRVKMRDALRTAFPGGPTHFELLYSPAPNTAGFFTLKASDGKGVERIVMVRLLPRPREDPQWKVDQLLVVGAQTPGKWKDR